MSLRVIFGRIVEDLAWVSGGLIIFAMLLVVASVSGRVLLDRPIPWTLIGSEIVLVYVTFLTMAWVLKEGRHIRVDILYGRLRPRMQTIMDLLSSIIGAILSLVFIVYGVQATIMVYQLRITTGGEVLVPIYLLQIVIPIGAVALLIQFLIKFLGDLRKLGEKP